MLNLLLHACAASAATLALPQDPYTELFGATLHFGDFDRDGAEDIYVSDPVAGDRLLHNGGGGLYEDVTAAHGLDADARSLFALWFDFDADGGVDLCVGGLDGSLRLLQNADRGHFVDVTPNTGLQVEAVGLDAEARDLDGDGRIDLHVSTELGGALFRNAGAGRFERLRLPEVELTALLGVDATAETNAATGLEAGRDAGNADSRGSADIDDDAGRSASRAAAARARRSALAARLAAASAGAQGNAGAASTAPGPPTTNSLLTSCAIFVDDQATANCIQTSSVPTLGLLYPLSTNLFVATNGRVGLGTTAPENRLHVHNGSAGAVTAGAASIGVFENNAAASLHVLTPDANERAVVFSGPATAGALVHNSTLVPNGFELRTASTTGTRMVITAAGNVGIGSNTPTDRLAVGGSVLVDATEANVGSHTNALRFGGAGTGEAIGSRRSAGENQYGLDFYTNTARRMAITLGGNVGIGTGTPETRLHVLNNSAGAFTATSTAIAVLENNANTSLEIITPDANERSVLFSGPNTAGAIIHNTPAVPNGFELRTVSPSGTRMVITAAGNVGIGTTSPGNPLQVVGGVTTVASFRGNQAGGTWLDLANTSINGRTWALLSAGAGNGEGAGTFAIHDHGASTTRMVIDTVGDVGIGTLTPDHRLHVVASTQQPVHFVGSNGGGTWVNVTNTTAGGDTWNLISTGSGSAEGAGKLVLRDADSNTVAMTLQPNGNVGIGTTAPAYKLDVIGETRVSGTTRFNGKVHVDYNNTNTGGVTSGALAFGDEGTGEGIACRKNTGVNDNQLDFYTAFTSRLTIDNSGRVGIGRQPSSFALEVQGDACKTGGTGFWNVCSDARIKTDVRTIDSALSVLDKLRLVEYRYTDEYLASSPSTADKRYFNVIAQEYAEVFPEYVSTSDADGILKVDTYPALIHALAAVQELHDIVRAQEAVLADAAETAAAKDAQIAGLEERLARLEATFERFAATQVSGDGR